MKWYNNLDMVQNEIQNAVVQVLSAAPGSPKTGQIYFDSTLTKGQMFTGVAWKSLTNPDWSEIFNKPTSGVAAIDDAVDKAHIQNSDYKLVANGVPTELQNIGPGSIAVFKNSGGIVATIDNTGNFLAPSFSEGYTTTATSAGTTTLTTSSNAVQHFTGTTTHIAKLPVTSTLTLGRDFLIVNKSTGVVTVQASDASIVVNLAPATRARVTCIDTAGTTNAAWDCNYEAENVVSGKKLTVNNTIILSASNDTSTLNIGTGGTLNTGAFAVAYTHPNHTGDVTSVGGGATTIGANKVTNAMLAQMPTMTIKGNNTAGTANAVDLTKAQVQALLNVADGANNYVHPTGDGNLHVPATSTNHLNYVLQAGPVAGDIAWGLVDWAEITSKPTLGTAAACNTGIASGNVPVLDGSGKLNTAVLPAIAVTDTFVAADQAAMLALSTAGVGDIAIRTDVNKSFILKTEPYSVLANWQELLTPTDAVTSVAGRTGAVTLVKGDVGLGSVDNTSDANKPVSTATQTALDGKAASVHAHGNITNAGAIGSTANLAVLTGASGVLTTGTVPVATGGTGATTAAQALVNLGLSATAAELNYTDGVTSNIQTQLNAKVDKYTQTITGSATSEIITHNLGTQDVCVSVRRIASPYDIVMCDIECTSVNTITLRFATAPAAGEYRVTVLG